MKKGVLTMTIMILILLFPAVVFAEETESPTKYQEIRESVSNAYSKVKDYVQERREARESKPAVVEPQIVVENESNKISIDTSIEYEKEYENIGFSTNANANATLTNNDGLLKDSSGSVNTDVTTTVTIKDQDLLSTSTFNITDTNTNSIAYSLNNKSFGLSGKNDKSLATNYDYQRVNILGKISKIVNKNTLFRTSNSADLNINKNNSGNKTIYDIIFNTNSKGSADIESTRTRRTLLGKEKTTTTRFSTSGEINYYKKLTISTPNKDNPDPIKPDPVNPNNNNNTNTNTNNNVTSISTDKVTYLSASTNPLTNDSIVKDMILLLVSITSMLGMRVTSKHLSHNK